MAPISDLYVTLVDDIDGGLNFFTTDTNFQGGGDGLYIYFESTDYSWGNAAIDSFNSGGNGSIQWADLGISETFQPSLPLNIKFIVNDDDDPSYWSANDSVFYYNLSSPTNDIFDSGNDLSEGKYIDVTSTDRAVLSFDESTLAIENINGENFLNISGKIENYQSLVDAYGQLTRFERINFEVENDKSGSSSGYDIHFEFQKPVDENTSSNLFDLSIPIPDYIPNGTINISNINGALSFENRSWLNTEVVSTGSINYDGRVGSDTVDPTINYLNISQGERDYPSIVIDGSITDDVQLDYVVFEVKWPNIWDYDRHQSFVLPSSAIDENGNFSIEYALNSPDWQYVDGDLSLHAALAFDSSNNFTLYNDIDISGYFRGGNSNMDTCFL